MKFNTIQLEVSDGLAILTLNQPASRNGLTDALIDEMLAALEQLANQQDARALILTGAGKSFCSGANLTELIAGDDPENSIGQRCAQTMEQRYNPMIQALRKLSIPIVAAVNGAAAGAGFSIALAADMVIAARSAYFLASFLPRLGLIPDLGATWFLPRDIGRARTMGTILLGERISAQQAEKWGLIWRCVDDAALLAEAIALARRLAKAPAHSVQEARRALDESDKNSLAEQLNYEKERQKVLLDLPSCKEGVQAFLEKREPDFRG